MIENWRRLAIAFGAASLLAVGAGGWATFAGGTWIWNAAAWVLGAAAALLIRHLRPATLFPFILWLTPLLLLASLLSPGPSGVHRWIRLGPVSWHAAFLLLPATTVATAALGRLGSPWPWWVALAVQLELFLQPDASQATAFGGAMIAALVTSGRPVRMRGLIVLLLGLAAGASWMRPDPLAPVPEVEGVIALAATVSVALAALGMASIAGAAISPLLTLQRGRVEASLAARALSVYFVLCAVMPSFGAFPVPLMGMGMSPILGYWIGVGMLLAWERAGGTGNTELGIDMRGD